jgi:hypothetical protein
LARVRLFVCARDVFRGSNATELRASCAASQREDDKKASFHNR